MVSSISNSSLWVFIMFKCLSLFVWNINKPEIFFMFQANESRWMLFCSFRFTEHLSLCLLWFCCVVSVTWQWAAGSTRPICLLSVCLLGDKWGSWWHFNNECISVTPSFISTSSNSGHANSLRWHLNASALSLICGALKLRLFSEVPCDHPAAYDLELDMYCLQSACVSSAACVCVSPLMSRVTFMDGWKQSKTFSPEP